MNERIRESLKQSGLEIYGLGARRDKWEFAVEQFAHMIVLECVTAVMNGTREGDYYAQRIEQHFDKRPGGILYYGVEDETKNL